MRIAIWVTLCCPWGWRVALRGSSERFVIPFVEGRCFGSRRMCIHSIWIFEFHFQIFFFRMVDILRSSLDALIIWTKFSCDREKITTFMWEQKNYKLHITAPQTIIEACLLPEADKLLITYPQLEMKLASTHASLAFGETDLILSFLKPEEGRIFRFRIGHQICGFYHAARFKNNLQGWVDVDSETGPRPKLQSNVGPLNQSPRLTV